MSTLTDVVDQFKGKTPDAIAAMIAKRGIKGRMGTTYRCPMALLLDGVSTGSYIIGRKFIVRRSGKTIEKVRTPENMSIFVRRFDIGKYPELIAPPPRCLAPPIKRPGRTGSDISNRKARIEKREIRQHLANLVERFAITTRDAG